MKPGVFALLAFLLPTAAAAFDTTGVVSACAGVARGFFSIVPVAFTVGSAIGLISRQ